MLPLLLTHPASLPSPIKKKWQESRVKYLSLTYSWGVKTLGRCSLSYNSSSMQTNPQAESSWLYHTEPWQEPSLVSKLHFFQADDMCQALIPGAIPACQLRKGFCNAFGFFEIPQVTRQQLTPTPSQRMGTWPGAQAEVDLEVLDFYWNHFYLLTGN